MVNLIDPKVNVVDYGPAYKFEDGTVVTPDIFVAGAAAITYKDIGALSEIIEKMRIGEIDLEKVKKSLVKSGGSGHASMATTPAFWLFLEGNPSKMVDSIFTGARFSSSLMPSGRRVPVSIPQIVVPHGIYANGEDAINLYMQTSERNIRAYELLQQKGVPKEEAAKIVQYGHRGGGFVCMPLETFIAAERNIEEEGSLVPSEGKEIVRQIRDFIYENGVGITYEARKHAPRTGCVNPNLFHRRVNKAEELIQEDYGREIEYPILLHAYDLRSQDRDKRIKAFIEKRGELAKSPDRLQREWPKLLRELELIVEDYNDSVVVKTLANSPWRIWGEVKRHRTMDQTAESVYNAAAYALNLVNALGKKVANFRPENRGMLNDEFNKFFSMPPAIKENEELMRIWLTRVVDSFSTYETLIKTGVPESDAIQVVPRGMKMGILKTYNLYNLTTGYMSLRLCSTAEPEMNRTTVDERRLIESALTFSEIGKLLGPKCHYTGFCHEDKLCGLVRQKNPDYTPEFHKAFKASRELEMLSAIEDYRHENPLDL